MSRSKDKGTEWETAIVNYLQLAGFEQVERRALRGVNDQGDIAGLPGVVIEAKWEERVQLAGWLAEAEAERTNAAAEVAVVWAHRRGKSSPANGYVIMTGGQFVNLLKAAGW